MFNYLKTKILIILLIATFMISAVLMAYQPRDKKEETGLAQNLWGDVQSHELPVQKNIAYSKDFPAGFRDASMGKAVTGPIKVEGG